MSIRQAVSTDLETVKNISEATISEIYPHYYPPGAVEFFLEHHNETNILSDIGQNMVFLCLDAKEHIVGTVTIKNNEICRLFVLPQYQGNGYGKEMLGYAEKIVSREYTEIMLAASLPAKGLYLKRGYKDRDFHVIAAGNGDFLCYDVMKKSVKITG